MSYNVYIPKKLTKGGVDAYHEMHYTQGDLQLPPFHLLDIKRRRKAEQAQLMDRHLSVKNIRGE
ncbi:hypothetical protein LCGC14_0728280 [marine sediment metagenome]|uniref:Uncharacterized protein n=1 Tax=marine sediment metagenome TaxID=412755 RepID=A0A0F9THK4_9ZZZZ